METLRLGTFFWLQTGITGWYQLAPRTTYVRYIEYGQVPEDNLYIHNTHGNVNAYVPFVTYVW